MAARRLGTTLKNLFLALLNATLILMALCLFLAWQTFQSFNDISATFADQLVSLTPLREDIQALTAEGKILNEELRELRTAARTGTANVSPLLEARIVALDDKLTGLSDRANGVLDAPEELIFEGIDQGARALTQSINDILGCTRPPSTATALLGPADFSPDNQI